MFPKPTAESMKAIAKKYGFPVGADRDVLGLAFAYGKYFAEEGNNEAARYCWEILYDLTNDEKVRKMMDRLPKNVQ